MNKEVLIDLISKGYSTYRIAKELNKGSTTIIYWIGSLGLNELYKNRPYIKSNRKIINDITKEKLEEAASNCNSIADMINYYGKTVTGANYTVLKRYINEYNINISHFHTNKGGEKNRIPDKLFFDDGEFRAGKDIKNRLRRYIPFICNVCGIEEIWNGKKLVLQLNHKDGKNTNNKLDNLELLCPNCHSQTDNFAGKNKKNTRII